MLEDKNTEPRKLPCTTSTRTNYFGVKSPKVPAAHGLRKNAVSRPVSMQAIFSTVSTELVPNWSKRPRFFPGAQACG
jgi:hypothetical protein